MKILITGGAGYIGSTIVSAIEDKGHVPVILDSLVAGKIKFTKGREFYKGDIADWKLLKKIFKKHPDIKHVIHCAALIIIPESVLNPYNYYRENVGKTLEFLKNIKELGCKNIIFSSSASIYDVVPNFEVKETSPLKPLNPYARTKFMMEMIIEDFCHAYNMRGIILRYFNPIGADPKMRSGEYLKNPSHILAKLVNVATGKEKTFKITGVNYKTRDGSGIRDYIHVWDLACAHVDAVVNFDKAFSKSKTKDEHLIINLGMGMGVTVFEFVSTFEKVFGKKINKKKSSRRPGDVAGAYANTNLAKKLLGWKTKLTIKDAIENALEWRKKRKNFLGY